MNWKYLSIIIFLFTKMAFAQVNTQNLDQDEMNLAQNQGVNNSPALDNYNTNQPTIIDANGNLVVRSQTPTTTTRTPPINLKVKVPGTNQTVAIPSQTQSNMPIRNQPSTVYYQNQLPSPGSVPAGPSQPTQVPNQSLPNVPNTTMPNVPQYQNQPVPNMNVPDRTQPLPNQSLPNQVLPNQNPNPMPSQPLPNQTMPLPNQAAPNQPMNPNPINPNQNQAPNNAPNTVTPPQPAAIPPIKINTGNLPSTNSAPQQVPNLPQGTPIQQPAPATVPSNPSPSNTIHPPVPNTTVPTTMNTTTPQTAPPQTANTPPSVMQTPMNTQQNLPPIQAP